jgi:hypothetical protein
MCGGGTSVGGYGISGTALGVCEMCEGGTSVGGYGISGTALGVCEK